MKKVVQFEEMDYYQPNSELKLQDKIFIIKSLLGRGAEATVYRAESDNVLYTIKVINCPKSNQRYQKIINSLNIQLSLKHQNIQQLLFYEYKHLNYSKKIIQKEDQVEKVVQEVQSQTEAFVCVFEYVKFTLKQGVRYNPINAETMVVELCQALKFLHDQKIVHRDVKNTNILLSETNELKLADFGFARVIDENLQMTRLGTELWIAPELYVNVDQNNQKMAVYDERVDVWAVGIFAYVITSGKYPFSGFVNQNQVENLDFDIIRSGLLKEIAKQCLVFDYQKRPFIGEVIAKIVEFQEQLKQNTKVENAEIEGLKQQEEKKDE